MRALAHTDASERTRQTHCDTVEMATANISTAEAPQSSFRGLCQYYRGALPYCSPGLHLVAQRLGRLRSATAIPPPSLHGRIGSASTGFACAERLWRRHACHLCARAESDRVVSVKRCRYAHELWQVGTPQSREIDVAGSAASPKRLPVNHYRTKEQIAN